MDRVWDQFQKTRNLNQLDGIRGSLRIDTLFEWGCEVFRFSRMKRWFDGTGVAVGWREKRRGMRATGRRRRWNVRRPLGPRSLGKLGLWTVMHHFSMPIAANGERGTRGASACRESAPMTSASYRPIPGPRSIDVITSPEVTCIPRKRGIQRAGAQDRWGTTREGGRWKAQDDEDK